MQSTFNLHAPEMIAFVGGGGKTSLMFTLANALPGQIVTTTTTRIFAAQMKLSPAVCFFTAEDTKNTKKNKENFALSASFAVYSFTELSEALDRFGQCLVVGAVGEGKDREKALGVPLELPGQLLARPDVDFVLVEADGSRMRPIKAPAEHEPVIPPGTTLVVPVVGIDAVGGRIAEVAHRPELVCSIVGDPYSVIRIPCEVDDVLTAEMAAALLVHPQGGLKGVPDGARVIPFINKVETASQFTTARQIAHHVFRMTHDASRISQVVIGAIKTEQPIREVHKRVTAVILAAGQSKRMGQTKQLLPWGETTVLGQVLRNVQATAVHHTLVVTGHEAEKVEQIAAQAGAETVFNPNYASGEMLSSLQTAVRHLPDNIAAVLVVLADQPMVEAGTIDQLLEAYWQQKGGLIAPVFQGQRGNPVLIDRAYFAELLDLPAGAAPRHLLRRHEADLYFVSMDNDSVLCDLDHPGEYERWRPTE
ncbi:MAG: putative selenium-dependent hydroxylase accessory protein YqeC [Ardenticatenaceae bacterium]|nr:putative selenium-dependent hydroxylase accessory protein YqeC [Ardenticatenaceae bacterium]